MRTNQPRGVGLHLEFLFGGGVFSGESGSFGQVPTEICNVAKLRRVINKAERNSLSYRVRDLCALTVLEVTGLMTFEAQITLLITARLGKSYIITVNREMF